MAYDEHEERAMATLVEAGFQPRDFKYAGSSGRDHFFVDRQTGRRMKLSKSQTVTPLTFHSNKKKKPVKMQNAMQIENCPQCQAHFEGPMTVCPKCGFRVRSRREKVAGLHPDSKAVISRAISEIASDSRNPQRQVVVTKSEAGFALSFAKYVAEQQHGFGITLDAHNHPFTNKTTITITRRSGKRSLGKRRTEAVVLADIKDVFDQMVRNVTNDLGNGTGSAQVTYGYDPPFRSLLDSALDKEYMALSARGQEKVGWLWEKAVHQLEEGNIFMIGDEGDGTVVHAITGEEYSRVGGGL